jgi:hypothetical protein
MGRRHVARGALEVEGERAAMREEWDARMNEITRIQEEADKLRAGRKPG